MFLKVGIYNLTTIYVILSEVHYFLSSTSQHNCVSDFYNGDLSKAYVIVGENDSPAFISQAKEFCGKLKTNGFTQAILEIIDEKDHFDLVEKLSEKEDVLTQLMLKCIK